MRRVLVLALAAAATLSVLQLPAAADEMRAKHRYSEHRADGAKARHYRRAPAVRGYVVRRGGYSYVIPDAINTYGDARARYGLNNFYRDPMADKQSQGGPFDHGFFFDSGIAPRGGDSPYMN